MEKGGLSMGKLFINYLMLGVSVQAVCYLFWVFNLFGGLIEYPLGDVSSLSSLFSIDAYSVLIGFGGAAIIGLAAWLFKQGTYAIYAMLIWAIGCMFNIVKTFLVVIPNTIGALLPNSTNPLPPDPVTGVYPTNPLIVVVVFFFTFGAWLYFFGLVIQREHT
jgi:hypothetical protein